MKEEYGTEKEVCKAHKEVCLKSYELIGSSLWWWSLPLTLMHVRSRRREGGEGVLRWGGGECWIRGNDAAVWKGEENIGSA